jgi:hypothetical protein
MIRKHVLFCLSSVQSSWMFCLLLQLDTFNRLPKLMATFPKFGIADIHLKLGDNAICNSHRFLVESRDLASSVVGYGWGISVAIGQILSLGQIAKAEPHHHVIWWFDGVNCLTSFATSPQDLPSHVECHGSWTSTQIRLSRQPEWAVRHWQPAAYDGL